MALSQRVTEILESVYNKALSAFNVTILNSKIDVALQDQTSPIIILRMHKDLGEFTLDGVQTINSFVINAESGHGATAGEAICIQEYDTVNNIPRFFQASIISTTATTLTIDRPLDYAFGTNPLCVKRVDINIANQVGTVADPVIFAITPASGVWDITRIIVQVFTAGTMDDGKFGSIDALQNGITLRKHNGYIYNICTIKSNAGWSAVSYDTKYVDKPPAGTGNGFSARLTFAGQNKIGVTTRLDSATGDKLELIVSDDLSDFGNSDKYIIVVEGHVVE